MADHGTPAAATQSGRVATTPSRRYLARNSSVTGSMEPTKSDQGTSTSALAVSSPLARWPASFAAPPGTSGARNPASGAFEQRQRS